jgi:hypothetical protein
MKPSTGASCRVAAANSTPQSTPSVVLSISLITSGVVRATRVVKARAKTNSFRVWTITNSATLPSRKWWEIRGDVVSGDPKPRIPALTRRSEATPWYRSLHLI